MALTSTFSDNRQRVLDATEIVRLVGEHLTLKPKGREYVGLCPFHDDRTPSMYVAPAKQIFHCFACGAGGNAIDFVMKFHGMAFREALEFLANRAGIELQKFSGARPETSSGGTGVSREALAEANAFAQNLFRALLAHPEHGAEARAFIERRGMSAAMVEEFQLGVSPNRWDGLIRTIESKSAPVQSFVEAGLLKRRGEGEGGGSGGYYDTFRHRLMFPIFDQIGRVVAFGGRVMTGDEQPKYLNSPETRLFDKSSTLFGLKQAMRAIQAQRSAIITEGYIDVIACHQAGFANAVATLGTALTPKHAAILRRLCDSVTLLFDGDEAGQRAADRALEVFFREPVDVRVATLPGGVDPDDLLRQEDGAAKFRAALESAQDLLDFRFQRLREKLDERKLTIGSVGRASAIENEIDRLVELGLRTLPPVRRQTVVSRLARIAGVDAAAVNEALRRKGMGSNVSGARGSAEAEEPVRTPTRRTAVEYAFGCLIADPLLVQTSPGEAREIVERVAYGSPPLKEAAQVVLAALGEGGAPTLSELLLRLESEEARSAATALAAETDRLSEGDAERIAEHWRQCVRRAELEESFGGVGGRGLQPSPGDVRGSEEKSEGGAGLDAVLAALERKRREHARLGGNPLALPRPTLGAG